MWGGGGGGNVVINKSLYHAMCCMLFGTVGRGPEAVQPAEADRPAGEAHAATDQVLTAAAGHPQEDRR